MSKQRVIVLMIFANCLTFLTTVRVSSKTNLDKNPLEKFNNSFPPTTNPIAQAGQFNFFIEENMESQNGDIDGAGAIGGNLILNGSNSFCGNNTGNFQLNGDSRPTGLVIGGRIQYNGGSGVNVNQNAYVKLGNTNGSTVFDTQNNTNVLTQITSGSYNSNPRVSLQTHQPASSVLQSNLIDFSSIFDDFRCYSDGMEELANNTSFTVNGSQAYINVVANRVNVLNVTGNQLNNVQGLIFQGTQPNASTPLIINVDAAGTFNWNIPSFNAVGDTQGKYIILNFYNSTTIYLNGGNSIVGAFFAPRAQVNKYGSGNVNGQMIAKSYLHGAGELHHHPFQPTFNIPTCVDCSALNLICQARINRGSWNNISNCTQTVCVGDDLILGVDPDNLASYQWTGPNGFAGAGNTGGAILINTSMNSNHAGVYTVVAEDANGCTATASITVSVSTVDITSVTPTDPSNCPQLTNGSITINATGSNLEYSVYNGGGYQPSNVFNNLPVGSNYQIVVRNTSTGCTDSYGSNVVINTPTCGEICDNGIDDDGNGQIDCNDGSCQTNSISIQPIATTDCTQDGSGEIALTVTGGTSPYTYQWSDLPTPTAYWGFDNTTNDLSGNYHHENTAHSIGTPTYSNDAKEGTTSLALNGSQYLRYSQDGAFMESVVSSFVAGFWMKPSNLTGTKVIFDEGGATNGISIYLVNDLLRFATRNRNIQKNAGNLTVPNDNDWHYILAVFQNNELTLYLDGVKGTSVNAGYANGTIDAHTGNGGIGYLDGGSGKGDGDGENYAGLLDGFKVYYNQYFTDEQLVDLARNDGNRTGLYGNQNYTVTVRQTDGQCATSADVFVANTCSEICNDGVDNDGDGLVDCDDPDCSLMTNSGLEEGNNNFTYPFDLQGNPAKKIAKNSTELTEWVAGLNGDCMYYVQDTDDHVNNPEGEYFIWLPDQWDCLISTQDFALMGMVDGNEYTISFNVASWEISLDASCEPDGESVTQGVGKVNLDMEDHSFNSSNLGTFDIPQSTSWANLNWKKISHTFTYNAANHRQFGVTNATANGIAVDNIIITAGQPCSTEPPASICNVIDLAELEGTTTNVINAINTANIKIGDAVVTMEAIQFAGNASLDGLAINDDHEIGSYGIKVGVNSSSPSDYLTAMYTFSQPVAGFNGRLIDIDFNEAINLIGRRNGVDVSFTLSNVGSCLSYDGNHKISSICTNSNGDQFDSMDHAFDFTFDGEIDELVIESFDQGPGSGGSQTLVLSPNESCAEYTQDCTNKVIDGELDNGTNDWGFYTSTSSNAAATLTVDNSSKLSGVNAAFIDITSPGANSWDIQFLQSGFSIEAGKEYNVSFEAMAPNTRPIQFAVQKATADYRSYGDGEVTITSEPQTYTYSFIAQETNAGDVAFIFHLGGEAGNVYIDKIHFGEACGTEICDNNIDDDNDGLIDEADPDCSSSNTCSATGTNLFNNPSFENGNWTGSETFIPGVFATPSYEIDDWSVGPSKWVETSKATEGNKVIYLNDDDPNTTVCIDQAYNLGFGQILNDCDTYQVCFDWASFNSDYPDGRSTRSQPALDILFRDANGDNINYANLPIDRAVANQDWDNLTWSSVSLTFQLKGSFTPPANATSIVVFLSEHKGMANGLLLDNVKLAVLEDIDCPIPPSNCDFTADAGVDQNNCAETGVTLTASGVGGTGGTTNYTYSWNTGATTQSITVNPTATTTYTVAVSDGTCISYDQVVVNMDNCTEICDNGIDDDGDGQIDCNDGDCGKPVITSVTPTSPNNCPDLNNGTITIIATGSNLEYSIDNGNTFHINNQFSNLVKGSYNIKVRNTVSGCSATSATTLYNSSCNENCTDGIDNNGDGQVDCDDDACGRPEIIEVTPKNSDNCPALDNGQITIIASGVNLQYSIDNGVTFQSARTFINLIDGTYTIVVKNNTTGCQVSHPNAITLTDPTCGEICDNGIDDDGDGLIDYQDDVCSDDWPQVDSPVATWLCEGNDYTFEVQAALPDFQYEWNFGSYSSIATATGIGPHIIQFDPPTGTEAIFPVVYFRAIAPTYEIRDTYNFQIRPAIVITNIEKNDPSDCGEIDGSINLSIQKQSDACVEVSFDGGNGWIQENRVRFDRLKSGNYNIVARYCDESCGTQSNIITLTNPGTSTVLGNDDFTDICPGQIYTNTVISNDIVQNRSAQYSIASTTSQGEVTMQSDGSFEYIVADSTFCGVDQFSYNVCNQNNTCCTTAFVTLYLTDTTNPILENVPDDITIGCDEEIPLPPFITAYDNCPSISIDKDEVSTQGLDECALHSYTITRTWTAIDVCGNSTTDEQIVSIEDAIAPDIFRIYTLPNGKKMVAGVMENVAENWKTVSFPIQFSQTPLVFTQVVSNKDTSAVTSRIRNISANQFELKLQQEEANTSTHFRESVSWIAMEAGAQTEGYLLDAKTIDVTDAIATINFSNAFNSTPTCFTSMQTINEADPGATRLTNLGTSSVKAYIQEEKSNDTELKHNSETIAYLALEQVGNIKNNIGDIIGEVGTINIDHQWTRVMTNNTYYNPIIITQVTTKNGSAPVLSRVNIERSGSFDLRLQEWDYLDQKHAVETASYIVIEGSLPLNTSKYCQYGTDSLELGVDMVAVDNCDPSVKIQYAESNAVAGANNHTIRTWFAEDACGNNTVYSQVINCQGISLRLKAYLQGALVNNGTTGLMRDDLRIKGLIPTTEPYSDMEGFKHVGTGGGETVSAELLAQTGNDAIVDWVFLEIKDGNNFEEVLVTCSALIQRDGDVVTAEGEPIVSFYNLAHGDYYLKLRHRNHLGIETAFPYIFAANNIPFIDFSDGFTPVRGNTPRVEVDDKLASWSGDLNGDDLTVFQGPNNDIFYMFLQILLDEQNEDRLSNFISEGYTTRDFNMDGTVIFQGPNNDRSILLWNTVYNHPDNEQNQSNFVVTTAEVVTQANYNDCIRDNTQSFCDFDNDGTLNGSDPDDDNDGVADGNDVNPYDKNSDSDGDSISDDIETGQDGTYQSGTDTDPLSPCDPRQDNDICVGIDMDGDSLYSNYPVNHAKYDPNDQNACEPNGDAAECSCPDEDGDGFIFACSNNGSTDRSTVRIPVADWLAQQAIGTVCGPCQDTIDTSCDEGVNLLSSTYDEVKGVNQKPRILNFAIPRGENRTLVIIADFEREHCDDDTYCDPTQNPNGEWLGDNFAFKNTNNGTPFISAKLSSTAGTMFLHSSVESSLTRNVFKFQSMDGTQEKATHSRELYMLTLEEASIEALLGNVNSGTIDIRLPEVSTSKDEADEAILFAYVFENVAQEEDAVNLFKGNLGNDNVSGDFSLALNNMGNGAPTDQAEDGLLVIGMNPIGDAGFNTLEGFTELNGVSVQNPLGSFTENNEGDGMSTSVQFRNGIVLAPLQLQSTGPASITSFGGIGLVFSIHSCYNNSLDTPVLIDEDGDGYYSNTTPYDAQDNNACYPVVSAVCVGEDNDGDGVFGNYPPTHGQYDADDMNPCVPFEHVFVCEPKDLDNDGYYGNTDPSDANFDIDDFNSCIPEVGLGCNGIDSDNDGTFGNYPGTHPDYDLDDNDPCNPDPSVFACNPLDADADGYFANTDSNDPYYDIDDQNPCIPVVSANCFGVDNDNDNYYANYPPSHNEFDPDDSYECVPDPNICNADEDGDGIEAINDPNDFDPCDPVPGNPNCIAIDNDSDGYYTNYPPTHELFDPNDNDDCSPNNVVCQSCKTFYGFAQVCVNAGTPNEESIRTTNPDYYTNGNPNAYCGPCADYSTIADGNWDDMNIWKNGNIPPYIIYGQNIVIRHHVTAHQEIKVNDGANLYVRKGLLHIKNNSLHIFSGIFSSLEAEVYIDQSLIIDQAESTLLLRDGVLNIGQAYNNNSGSKVYYENMCVGVSNGNYVSNYNLEVFDNSRLTIQNGNLEYTGNTGSFTANIFTVLSSRFDISGNFINNGKIKGLTFIDDIIALKVGGNVYNAGTWQCYIEQAYCIGGSNGIPSSQLQVEEDCGTIDTFFPTPCAIVSLADDDNDGVNVSQDPDDTNPCVPNEEICNLCEDYDEDGLVVVCKSGITELMSPVDYFTTKQEGDYCGPCGDFRTITYGLWDDPNVWENGNVPPYQLNDQDVIINHHVTTTETIVVDGGSYLWVQESQLNLDGDDKKLQIKNGSFYNISSTTTINNNLELATENAKVVVNRGLLNVKRQLAIHAGVMELHHGDASIGEWLDYTMPETAVYINNLAAELNTNHFQMTCHNNFILNEGQMNTYRSCFNVKRDWINKGVANLSYSCLDIGKDLTTETGSQVIGDSLNIYLSSSYPESLGNMVADGTVQGQIGALFLAKGSATVSNWTASIDNHVVIGGSNISPTYILSEDYDNIAYDFSECTCLGYIEPPTEEACTIGTTNLALGKSATQSTTTYGGVADRAIDGNTDGKWSNGSVTHTDGSAQNGWWQVDLGEVQNIEKITVWNRTDGCCKDRLSNFYVFVSDTPFSSNDPLTTAGQSTVWNQHIPSLQETSISVFPGRTGRYVRVQIQSTVALSLAEVEIFGCEPTEGGNASNESEINTCIDDDGDGMITVCRRNNETETGTTENIPVADWPSTKQPYDYCGPCASYITVKDGDWGTASTWKNNNRPPYSISGDNVRINHSVTVSSAVNVIVDNGGYLTIDNGSLKLTSDQSDLNVKNGVVNSISSHIIVGDDLKTNNSTSKIIVVGSLLDVKKRLNHKNGTILIEQSELLVADGLDLTRSTSDDYDKAIYIYNDNANFIAKRSTLKIYHTVYLKAGNLALEETCTFVDMHWLNEGGTVSITNSDLEVAGDFTNEAASTTTFNNGNIYLSDDNPFDFGNLNNFGNVSGQINTLYIPNGYVDAQSWSANINNACISESSSNNIPTSYIGTNDCNNITSNFSATTCFEVQEPINGAMVNLLNEHTVKASGGGAGGVPTLTNFNIPAGQNRQMIVMAFFERNHCVNDCPPNGNYNGLGDQYANDVTNGTEQSFKLKFQLQHGATTTTKYNSTGDNFGNYHSARNMVFYPEDENNWQQELEDYHKAHYSTEAYFITYNEAEINALLGDAPSGDISVNFPFIKLPAYAADDAILTAVVFENVAQDPNGAALSGKYNGGKEFRSPTHVYGIDNLIDGLEPNEPTDGFFVIGASPIEGDFNTMPGFNVMARLNQSFTNSATGSTLHGEHNAISTSGQFRRGPSSGIINSVSMQGNGVGNTDPIGSVIFAFTLESYD